METIKSKKNAQLFNSGMHAGVSHGGKMKRSQSVFLLLISLLFMSFDLFSCSSMLNPYHSNFQCPLSAMNAGKCESIPKAYKDALNSNDTLFNEETSSGLSDNNNNVLQNEYQNSLYQQATQLMKKPQTPIVIPPKVMRIYFLPYEDKYQHLFMGQYIYIFVSKPKWVFSVDQSNIGNGNN